MKSKIFTTVLFFVLFIACSAFEPGGKTIYVANWNVQNLFDTKDDPGKVDEEFTPEGKLHWTEQRLETKLKHLAKVVSGMNKGEGPDLLGTEEVEHKALLERMLNYVVVPKHYKIAYAESPDFRGIDNGLIYNSDLFSLDTVETFEIHLPSGHPTRYILYVKLKTDDDLTLHVFVNHWPSRRGGLEQSRPNRIAAAKTLKNALAKVYAQEKNPFVIILGDFNDEPTNYSVHNVLGAEYYLCSQKPENAKLFNLSYVVKKEGKGSYKYRDQWNLLDQIIVSKAVILKNNFNYVCNSFHLVKPVYVIQKYGRYKGAILPTFGGRKYLAGYSDHYPVAAEFELEN